MRRSVLIIGLGNMGQALAKGLMDSALAETIDLAVYDIHAERAKELQKYGSCRHVQQLGEMKFKDETVILCVKPQDLRKVGAEIAGRLTNKNMVISILAGTWIKTVKEAFHFSGPVIRAMSNMPAVVRLAATAMTANSECQPAHKEFAEGIFRAVGEVYWTSEEQLDTVTGLSGSGPAYIYMVIEALTDGGVKMGLPRDIAAKLSAQTVLGAATLVKTTGMHPAVLRDQVATPAGTTISALHELEAHGLRNMFVTAVVAATERARVIGKTLNETSKDDDKK